VNSPAPIVSSQPGRDARAAVFGRPVPRIGTAAAAVVLMAAITAASDPPAATRDAAVLSDETLQDAMVTPSAALVRIADLMAEAGRDLGGGQTGASTRRRQQRAVEILDALIRAAEQQQGRPPQPGSCRQCGGRGCPACSSAGRTSPSGTPRGPAQSSGAVQGSAEPGRLHEAAEARPGEMWGRMRPEERDRILQSLNQSFPGRYRTLVEQYYRRLATE